MGAGFVWRGHTFRSLAGQRRPRSPLVRLALATFSVTTLGPSPETVAQANGLGPSQLQANRHRSKAKAATKSKPAMLLGRRLALARMFCRSSFTHYRPPRDTINKAFLALDRPIFYYFLSSPSDRLLRS